MSQRRAKRRQERVVVHATHQLSQERINIGKQRAAKKDLQQRFVEKLRSKR